MGKQIGIINIRGTVGDLNYVRTEDGYFIRRRSSVTKLRMATDPNYAATRDHQAEFKRASAAGKLFRDAVNDTLSHGGDGKVHSRLLKVMLQIIKSDPVSDRGRKKMILGELGFLEGFEFNRKNPLKGIFPPQYASAIDRAAGTLSVSIPAFVPAECFNVGDEASHFRIVSAGCELDFEKRRSFTGVSESPLLPINNDVVAAFTLVNSVTPGSVLSLVSVLGIRFYRMSNGKAYRVKSDRFNALRVMQADMP